VKKEAMLYERGAGEKVRCYLCSHRCNIAAGKTGICSVRENRGGALYTDAYGEVVAANADPIEKKPLYHFLPGTMTFSIATAGCNFRCGFCQNWQISQRSKCDENGCAGREMAPEEIVTSAQRTGCESIAYTYTEPTIFFEYAYETARLAKKNGLHNLFVTNGYMTAEALETIEPYLDACNVDLKSFRDDFYRETCKARLEPILETIRLIRKREIWLEVTTLVVPGQNDSDEELRDIVRFLFELDPRIPWHISRFYPDYQFAESKATPIESLDRARRIADEEGLVFVYTGNVPETLRETRCPFCREVLISGQGLGGIDNRLKGDRCPECETHLPGVYRRKSWGGID
jgi:pyruvate formate lyase activating enzyme